MNITFAKKTCISKSANLLPRHILGPCPYGNEAYG